MDRNASSKHAHISKCCCRGLGGDQSPVRRPRLTSANLSKHCLINIRLTLTRAPLAVSSSINLVTLGRHLISSTSSIIRLKPTQLRRREKMASDRAAWILYMPTGLDVTRLQIVSDLSCSPCKCAAIIALKYNNTAPCRILYNISHIFIPLFVAHTKVNNMDSLFSSTPKINFSGPSIKPPTPIF